MTKSKSSMIPIALFLGPEVDIPHPPVLRILLHRLHHGTLAGAGAEVDQIGETRLHWISRASLGTTLTSREISKASQKT